MRRDFERGFVSGKAMVFAPPHDVLSLETFRCDVLVQKDMLMFCVGYVQPNVQLPAFADPVGFFRFAKLDSGRRQWEHAETHGDKVLGNAIHELIRLQRIYSTFESILVGCFITNKYCGKLTRHFKLLELCKWKGSNYTLKDESKFEGDVFEVRRVPSLVSVEKSS